MRRAGKNGFSKNELDLILESFQLLIMSGELIITDQHIKSGASLTQLAKRIWGMTTVPHSRKILSVIKFIAEEKYGAHYIMTSKKINGKWCCVRYLRGLELSSNGLSYENNNGK